jgi:ornithine cyclodeaminase
MRTLSPESVAAALPYPALVERLRDAFRPEVATPARQSFQIELGPERAPASLLVMPAWGLGDLIGIKVVTVHPDLTTRPGGCVRANYMVLGASDGEPKAVFDAHLLTARRTAAQSVLAASLMARPDPRRLTVVGAGAVAGALAQAYGACFPSLETIGIWARREAAARELSAALCQQGLPATAVPNLPAALAGADIVSCATTSTAPLVERRDVRPGTHVDLVGGFRPAMREASEDLVAAAALVVDTPAAFAEAGDIVHPLQAGLIRRDDVLTLGQLVQGAKIVHREDGVTLFKSVGHAGADLAAASLLADAGLFAPAPGNSAEALR